MSVVCPGCGRALDLSAAAMSLPSIQCAHCASPFCPATEEVSPRGQTAVVLPDTMDEQAAARPPETIPDAPLSRVQRGGLVAWGLQTGILMVAGVLLSMM